MAGSNMFLTIGAIVLFSVLVLNVNRMIMGSEEQKMASEYSLMATSLGQAVLNEVSSKSFDEATINSPALSNVNLNILTPANLLRAESGEVLAAYNDVDDYNLHSRVVNISRGGDFNISVAVDYVNDITNIKTNVITRTKKIEVNITNEYMVQNPYTADTLKLYYYKSY